MDLMNYSGYGFQELAEIIGRLKREKNAVILAHNYQPLDVQKIADYLGDSLALARKAAETGADIILFCGVTFMAETAKILSPDKKVLIPDLSAGCALADFISADDVINFRKANPGYKVVTYVNSSAEVKAESDICCTSSNAIGVVNSLGKVPVFFIPDYNLGHYVRKETGADIRLWDGHCYVHSYITIDELQSARDRYPGATVIVHPECNPDIVEAADKVGSTGFMYNYAANSGDELIIGTEIGLIQRINYEFPQKKVHPLKERAVCLSMKRITLEKVAWALQQEKWEIKLAPLTIKRAYNSIKRMIEIG